MENTKLVLNFSSVINLKSLTQGDEENGTR